MNCPGQVHLGVRDRIITSFHKLVLVMDSKPHHIWLQDGQALVLSGALSLVRWADSVLRHVLSQC